MKILARNDILKSRKRGVESFSQQWVMFAKEMEIDFVALDCNDPAMEREMAECDGFMARFSTGIVARADSNRLLSLAEAFHRIPVYPDFNTRWFYEDKIVQARLFDTLGIPKPRTVVLQSLEEAREYLGRATYPLVLKLATGASSNNVALIDNQEEGLRRARELFDSGLFTLARPQVRKLPPIQRASHALDYFMNQALPPLPKNRSLEQGYMLLQEFIPGNDGDIRINVIGDRVWGYRRKNAPNDFRASGSGIRDYDHTTIPKSILDMAVTIARKLRTQSLVLDFLERDNQPVLVEISYTTSPSPVADCPGHWVVSTSDDKHEFEWLDKPLRIEKAILEDFVEHIRRNGGRQARLS